MPKEGARLALMRGRKPWVVPRPVRVPAPPPTHAPLARTHARTPHTRAATPRPPRALARAARPTRTTREDVHTALAP